MLNNYKKPLNHIIFHLSGFKHQPTTYTDTSTVYTLLDDKTNNLIKLFLWDHEGDTILSIEHSGIDNLSPIGQKRYKKFIERINGLEGLLVSEENINNPIFTDEQCKIIDQLCIENNIHIEEE